MPVRVLQFVLEDSCEFDEDKLTKSARITILRRKEKSFIHTNRHIIWLAYLVKLWVTKIPCHWTCEKLILRKRQNLPNNIILEKF